MSAPAAAMDANVYEASRMKRRVLVLGSSSCALIALTFLSFLVAFGPDSGRVPWSGYALAAGLGVLIAGVGLLYPVLNLLRRARPSVSDAGVVPSRWLLRDIYRRREIVHWPEIERIAIAHGVGWTAYFTLRDGTVRVIWSEPGVPGDLPGVLRRICISHGLEVEEAR